jgi:UDP-glucose 4-epimerase
LIESSVTPLVGITGASGFIGSNLRSILDSRSAAYTSIHVRTGVLDPSGFRGVTTVVHLAGIAHADYPDEKAVWAANAELPVETAIVARREGVKRFVFLSSALVWGSGREAVEMDDEARPDTLYGRAKRAAEVQLESLQTDAFRITIIRPPLVYGPSVRGNLLKMIRAIERWPLVPFDIRNNRRSMVSVANLAAFVYHLMTHNLDGYYSIAEPLPFSTWDIAASIAQFLPSPGKLVRPPWGTHGILSILRPRLTRQLFGSFEISQRTWRDTGFVHPFDSLEGFRDMTAHYRSITREK